MEKSINVIAGRPGAGKTLWACREAARLAEDENNTVIYIGHQEEFVRILAMTKCKTNNLLFARLPNAAEAIGRAIDCANAESGMFNDMTVDEGQEKRRIVYLFYDQCRFDLFPGRRILLETAAKAGVFVNVLCQVYSQVHNHNKEWLRDNCECMVISKKREPRLATKEEIHGKYCG